jgi:hypothetical protein
MDIAGLLNNNEIKAVTKREELADALRMGYVTMSDILPLKDKLDDKKMAIVLEAMEAVTNRNPDLADLGWLVFAGDFITSKSNAIKREASRIVGNIAHLFPDDLDTAIQKLMENTKDEGTVIRWASAYALARIIQIPQYARGGLFDTLISLSEQESENGVKNQLLNGLKKAKKHRL